MVKDGLDAVGAEMEVMDVAEILWEQIVSRDVDIHEQYQKKSGKARIWSSSQAGFI